jgi:ribosomal protein S18 acetylase RimI-like enzyme
VTGAPAGSRVPAGSGVPLRYRSATAADVPAIVALVQSAYRGDASRVGWTTEADLLEGQRTDPEAVGEAVDDPAGVLLLAFRGSELVACCRLQRHDDHAYFGMFAVRPDLQGVGVGKAVIAEAERQAVERWGVPAVQMTVISAREELLAWYERRGYRRTGQFTPFPYGDARFGVPLRADLVFETLIKVL